MLSGDLQPGLCWSHFPSSSSTQPWVRALQAADTPVQSMSFSPDGGVLAATSGGADVRPDERFAHIVCQLCIAPCWLTIIEQALCTTQSLPRPTPDLL